MRRIRILAPVFFDRFFDSDFASGAASLKTSFFWMVTFLAVPGIFMPVLMSVSWYFVVGYLGLAKLDELVRADKALYLGYSAWMIGLVASMTWNAMLLDRRDGLVLGNLPVSGRDIVGAKTLALLTYAGLLMLAMHVGSALCFGLFLGNLRGVASVVATTLATFVAASLCSLFVVFSMVALQGVALLLFGGRRFTSVSPFLQLAVVALLLAAGLYIPEIVNAVPDTIAGTGPLNAPWILRTPILWYLGVYDVLLGFREPVLMSLATTGIVNLTVVVALALVAMPLSYARLMTAAVEQTGGNRRRGVLSGMIGVCARLIARKPQRRGIAEFLLFSIARHGRPRLAMAVAIGGAAAWAGPSIAVAIARGLGASPSVAVLGVPLAVIVFLIAGFRIAASLPSDLPPRWVFATMAPTDADTRSALRRVTLAIAVIVPASVAALAMAAPWTPLLALFHFAVCVSTGTLLVELAFRNFSGVPCARPWRPDGANLRAWWPAYIGGFLLIVSGIPRLELMARADHDVALALVIAPVVAAAAVRLWSRHHLPEIDAEDDEPTAIQVLDL